MKGPPMLPRLPSKATTKLLMAAFVVGIGLVINFSSTAPALAQTPTQKTPLQKTLRVVPFADLQVLDPINTTAGNVQSHAMHVYDFLFGRDAQQIPQPQMVETYTVSDDGLIWTFTLRDGLKFHDGTPVTTEDVIQSLKRWGARDPYGRQIIALASAMEVKDAKTFT
jgi:peptide/nickel transport system substrate-binding protein